jgi:ADP-heptose:LPS heptosyltransferase
MARAELARFAVGRIGIARGHSIDRRELGCLFVERQGAEVVERERAEAVERERTQVADGGVAAAREFFGAFARVHSFFAAGNASFRHALELAAGGAVDFYPFRPPGEGHVAQCYLRAIGEPGGTALENPVGLLPADHAAAARIVAAAGLEPNRFVLIFPGSGSAAKNWPPENFAAAARKLKIPALVVLGPAEDALEPLFKERGLATLSGLELGVVAALAYNARCVAANDSGVAHLAAAAGAKLVAIFGPTDPGRWRPLGKVEVIRHEPLARLPIDTVADALLRLTA